MAAGRGHRAGDCRHGVPAPEQGPDALAALAADRRLLRAVLRHQQFRGAHAGAERGLCRVVRRGDRRHRGDWVLVVQGAGDRVETRQHWVDCGGGSGIACGRAQLSMKSRIS